MHFLDDCLASLPLYEPEDWFLLGSPQVVQLAGLVSDNIRTFPDLEAALCSNGEQFRERLAEELPGILRVAWEDIQTVSTKTLLNEASNDIRTMGSRDHKPLPDEVSDEAVDDTLARFEALEAARQELDALQREAALSPQQAEVWALSRKGLEFGEIASMLGKSPNQISVQKHNAVKQMRRTAEARDAFGR
jgi:DNA-binding CsgD family transcriptional regulator